MNRARHGFTLMELLVATLAAAVLLVAVYSVFSHGQQLRSTAETRTREARLQARALGLLRQDLHGALVLAGPIADTLVADLEGPSGRYPGYLRLTTVTGRTRADEPGADVQEVEYYVAPSDEVTADGDTAAAGAEPVGVLVRTVQRILLADAPDPPEVQPLLPGVEALTVRLYDGNQWLDQWDSTLVTNQLPLAVEVRVAFAPGEDDTAPGPLEVLVNWPTRPVTNQVAEGEAAT